MRVDSLSTVLPVAAEELEAARFLVGQIHQTNGEVLRKFIVLAHEHAELMLPIRRFQSHVIALHLSVETHFSTRRGNHLLRASDETLQFLVREGSHGSVTFWFSFRCCRHVAEKFCELAVTFEDGDAFLCQFRSGGRGSWWV